MTETMNRRRSWMILPAHKPAEVMRFQEFKPDVAVLDLEYSVPPRYKELARSSLKDLVKSLGASQAEVFVRVDRDTRWADVGAAVQRGIKGIIFPGPEESAEVAELGELISAKEKERGVDPGTTELVLMLESAKGFWNAAELAAASPRVTTLGVGRIDLTMRLGPVPQEEFRLYRFLMTRLLVAARMLAKQPLGALWRPGSRGGVASREMTMKAAREGRLLGFTGCLCATPEQVASINQGFTSA
ncbi:MAG: citrate lyase subunit beta / citryl-CoA lyase [Betaproteobacteria bacterium]|jgi:citrate lyase subunit beta/citryl-CoA lyase|nr:citrate lyase subunit beta / citryl-CoA lyase [Betaproteobacteria bacterium]